MRTEQHYDIAIIGEGITGLSAAYHLQRLGTTKVCILRPDSPHHVSTQAAGLVSSSLQDNITRLAHRHGTEAALAVWEWASLAFERVLNFADEAGLPTTRGQRLRWTTSPEEQGEAEQSVAICRKLGIEAHLLPVAEAQHKGFAGRAMSSPVQDEGLHAAYCPPQPLLQALQDKTSKLQRLGPAQAIDAGSQGINIITAEGCLRAEAVILANHLAIAQLLPSIEPALVAYADQWAEWQLSPEAQPLRLPVGSVFSWRHGHYWGGVSALQTLRLGGARFLRPLAGFEASSAPYEKEIEKHLKSAWEELFPEHPLGSVTRIASGLDCWPCDELPVIGPMYGEPRILLGTGYMGQGLSMGFYAGCCLAELVLGLRPPMPRLLWPERLRSLPEDV
jgi:glycine/D-amino acid oxidase-like deaminating enzyme